MLIDQDPELKSTILALPQKEKDKLLLRLISKDEVLINQLHFKLLEQEEDMEKRIKIAKAKLNAVFTDADRYINFGRKDSGRDLLIALKSGSGIINHHFLITKDAYTEISLRLHLLSGSIERYGDAVMRIETYHNSKLLEYLAGRIAYILKKYNRLHEDLQFDYRDDLNKVLNFAFNSGIKGYAEYLSLPQEV